MSDYTCVTKTKTYGPPCFIDVNGPNCEYEATECGMNLAGITRNAETGELFKAAALTGHDDVLSDEDIERYMHARLMGFIEPAEMSRTLKQGVKRFKENAEAVIDAKRVR